jgi:hypothetical protein
MFEQVLTLEPFSLHASGLHQDLALAMLNLFSSNTGLTKKKLDMT